MKRRDLLRRIDRTAKEAQVEWRKLRDRGDHEVWVCGGVRVPVPRHREIAEHTAEKIMKQVEPALGERWWR